MRIGLRRFDCLWQDQHQHGLTARPLCETERARPFFALMRRNSAETQAFLQASKLRRSGYRKVNSAVSLGVNADEGTKPDQGGGAVVEFAERPVDLGDFCDLRSLTNRLT